MPTHGTTATVRAAMATVVVLAWCGVQLAAAMPPVRKHRHAVQQPPQGPLRTDTGPGLAVAFSRNHSAYNVLLDGDTLFTSTPIAMFSGGRWHVANTAESQSQSGGAATSGDTDALTLQSASDVSGHDPTLGGYTGVELAWRTQTTGVRFTTIVKTFASGSDVLFTYAWPDGAQGTSTVAHANTTRDAVIVNWPSFATPGGTTTEGGNDDSTSGSLLGSTLSWEGSFVRPVMGGHSHGPTGGPTVFYDGADALLARVVVGAAWGEGADGGWKSYSAGNGLAADGTTSAWAPGATGTLQSVPTGFTQSTLLHLGARGGGVTATVHEWGQLLLRSRATRGSKIPDVTLTKIGYQTDNGAMYCFCRERNCSDVIIREIQSLAALGVPMGYLSFQGAGASSGRGEAAPWCVDLWGVDGGLGRQYPVPLGPFQQALGVPLQLYAPYFCPGSPYFNVSAGGNWTSVSSDAALQACEGFAFQDVAPAQSRAFYEWFFAKGTEVGMVSWEPDFMNQNYNCVPQFVHATGDALEWQHGMASAALAANVTVQWCFATPTDVMAAVDMPAVTNFRVSLDFCYGHSWDIGVSSLLVWALGARPSKDTLWTTTNNYTAIPGCPWTPDHEQPACELHMMLALMSTGPVGISDALGMSNATLLRRAVALDGTLLQPAKAITAVDATYLGGGLAPQGDVYATYGAGLSWSVVSFQLRQPYGVRVVDLWPSPLSALVHAGGSPAHGDYDDANDRDEGRTGGYSAGDGGVGGGSDGVASPTTFVYRQFTSEAATAAACVNGTDAVASGCVRLVSATPTAGTDVLFTAPASSFANVTGGTAYAPALITLWGACPRSGWVLLGELSKYVHLSPARFSDVECTAGGVEATVTGSGGETVTVAALAPGGGGTGRGRGGGGSAVFVFVSHTLTFTAARTTQRLVL